MTPFIILPLVALCANIALGVFIIYRDPKSRVNMLYALFSFSVAVLSFGNTGNLSSEIPEDALFWLKIGTVGYCLMPVLLLHFFIEFTGAKLARNRSVLAAMYIPVVFFLFIGTATNTIDQSAVKVEGWGFVPVEGSMYFIFAVYVLGYIYSGVAMCYLYYRRAAPKDKGHILKLFLGLMVPVVGGTVSQIVFPAAGIEGIQLTAPLLVVTQATIAWLMIKYRFLSITPEIAARKIISTINDFMVAVDSSGHIGLASGSVLESLGYSEGELIGADAGMLFSQGFKNIMDKVPASNVEAIVMAKGGRPVSVLVNVSELRDEENGATFGHLLVMRDVGEIRKIIKSLEEKTAELEKTGKELKLRIVEAGKLNALSAGRHIELRRLRDKLEKLQKD